MAEIQKGVALLKFGITETSGYITEALDTTNEGETLEVENEIGDVVSHYSGFGIRKKISVSFIPLATGSTEPEPGEVLTVGDSEVGIVKSCKKAQARKDVERWSLEIESFPEIALGGS